MGKTETTYRKAQQQLEHLQQRRDELSKKSEVATSDLAGFRKECAAKLISGGDGGRIAAELSRRESKAMMFSSALVELDAQIIAQQSVAAEAGKAVSAEAAAEAARQIRTSALGMIKTMAALQVDMYKCLEMQQQHMQRSPILDFNGAADQLAAAQEMLEKDATIVSQSKVPRARRIGGFIDDTNTVTSLGSQIRDWARQEVTG